MTAHKSIPRVSLSALIETELNDLLTEIQIQMTRENGKRQTITDVVKALIILEAKRRRIK